MFRTRRNRFFIRTCPNCGARLESEFVFCPYCGLRVMLTDEEYAMDIEAQAQHAPTEEDEFNDAFQSFRDIKPGVGPSEEPEPDPDDGPGIDMEKAIESAEERKKLTNAPDERLYGNI